MLGLICYTYVGDNEEDEDSIAASFPPLATLMKLLESKG